MSKDGVDISRLGILKSMITPRLSEGCKEWDLRRALGEDWKARMIVTNYSDRTVSIITNIGDGEWEFVRQLYLGHEVKVYSEMIGRIPARVAAEGGSLLMPRNYKELGIVGVGFAVIANRRGY